MKQAWAELGQAQIKLGLGLISIEIFWDGPDNDDRLVSVQLALNCQLELSLVNYPNTVYYLPKPVTTFHNQPIWPSQSTPAISGHFLQLHNGH